MDRRIAPLLVQLERQRKSPTTLPQLRIRAPSQRFVNLDEPQFYHNDYSKQFILKI